MGVSVLRLLTICFLALLAVLVSAREPDAKSLLKQAMKHWRGVTSSGEMTMVIHRPDWERSMSMRIWTEGDSHSLVRITAPNKDVGNATLTNDKQMWTFSPKINRVIKLPSSMMSQRWMGSDFSNNDISRSTEILRQYDHRLLHSYQRDGHTVYVVEAIPHEDAPVVWGREVVHIRDDYVMLREEFWDQDGVLVKTMNTLDIREMGGRTVAARMRMHEEGAPEQWTEVRTDEIRFDVQFSPATFTLSNLRNPRQ